ncbi:hypothetical protein GUJ93_ZPchr0011g27788 [Zizania palustris]|uniref:Uncharacterized protein n=1 Tax=Zizania palustris TaxID=103762 RepID=A0A8J5WK21_ZIZPA|nr:hypothetical protein GUJ93_ZPchr0011g27788 [Zizania palustris]
MARKKIREYDSKRQAPPRVTPQAPRWRQPPDPLRPELVNQHPWLSTMKLVVKPDMLFGKRGKSGLVALNLDISQVKELRSRWVAARLQLPPS